MERQEIIMSFTVPPSAEDLAAIAREALEALPEELSSFCEDLTLAVEELADEALEDELDLDTPFDLPALYRKGSQIAPGVQSKVANDDDVLILFRRALLDLWCESGEDINILIRQVMIEELAGNFDFSDAEITEMTRRHFQGLF
ncbi:MAG: metallopeptidase family protein [Alphaproteobacteria bacterium]|nr:metallopeptidase family protein [Alphaproteobacteria bacterium]